MSDTNFTRLSPSGYDQSFAHVSAHFIPFLLRAGRLAPGHRVLDIATGTGLAAAAALAVVGPTGHVTAADLSPQMVELARARLNDSPNVSLKVEDGHALGFPDESFDVVLCSLGLMFFATPARGLSEFRRVLRPGGRAAVSVNTVPERSYNTRVMAPIARYLPSLAELAARVFSLGDEVQLRTRFAEAGFRDVELATVSHRFTASSFEAYFEQFDQGWSRLGQAFLSLPDEARRTVREAVRRDLGDTGGPIEIEVEIRFASGQR